MSSPFNFNGLSSIYSEAKERDDAFFAFELTNGRGRFVFMMFFSKEDSDSEDRLFLQLRNTQVFLELKMYGSHKNGTFNIYFKDRDKEKLIDELQLGAGGKHGFAFDRFLNELNNDIPQTLPFQQKLNTIREIMPIARNNLNRFADDADRTILMGTIKLPKGKNPQLKTLRKLYFYTNGEAGVIDNLINALKNARVTLAWTNNPNTAEKSLADIMRSINQM